MDIETEMDDLSDLEETPILNIDNFTQKHLVIHQMFVIEIPSMIAVETRFITPQMANQKEILMSTALTISQEPIDNEANTPMHDPVLIVDPSTNHVSVQTDTPTPKRDRGQQTTKMPNHIDVGIQCTWETNLSDEDVQKDISSLEERNENENYVFLNFVEKNTNSYSNSKEECLVCGEICSNSKQIHSHMMTHWGPPALCEICGEQLKHTNLLVLHKCKILSKRKNKQTVHFQCPLYACGSMTKSKRQLNYHIGKHLDLTSNSCIICKGIFLQKGLEQQEEISLKSRRLKKRGIHKKHSLLSQNVAAVKSRLRGSVRDGNRCQICLVKCLNPSLFDKHRKKCVKYFKNRLEVARTRGVGY